MLRRIFLELTRVFVPAGRKPGLQAVMQRLDAPSGDLNDVNIDGESGWSRLRDSAGIRLARSRRRVWRPREARRMARLH